MARLWQPVLAMVTFGDSPQLLMPNAPLAWQLTRSGFFADRTLNAERATCPIGACFLPAGARGWLDN